MEDTAEVNHSRAGPVWGTCAFIQQSTQRPTPEETQSDCGDSKASSTCTNCNRYSSSDRPAPLRP